MGLGAFPAADPQWLGMLGMHGTYEATLAMHGCDLMICIGARLTIASPAGWTPSRRDRARFIDIDPSSINKNVKVDLGIVGDCGNVLADMLAEQRAAEPDRAALAAWWKQIGSVAQAQVSGATAVR
ncbi:MAG: hypothetical protein R3D52_13305 [Xanthobacteraceae bacterium]